MYCEQFVLFRHVCHKWHYKIAKALVVCLESKDFVFLLYYFRFQVCEDEKEKRQDLYIKARSYQGQLVARKSRMIKESDFHVVRKNTMLNINKTFLTFPFIKGKR